MPDNLDSGLQRVVQVIQSNLQAFQKDDSTGQIWPKAPGQGPTPGIIETDINVFPQTIEGKLNRIVGLYLSMGPNPALANLNLVGADAQGVFAAGYQDGSGMQYYGGEIANNAGDEFEQPEARRAMRFLLNQLIEEWSPYIPEIEDAIDILNGAE